MVKQSPHKRWKGHCPLCKGHKDKRTGTAKTTPFRYLRQLGKKRRLSRRDLGD